VLLVPLLTGVIVRLPGQSPLALQLVPEVVLETFQEIVALLPTKIDVGLMVNETAGGFGSTTIDALSKVDPVLLLHVIV